METGIESKSHTRPGTGMKMGKKIYPRISSWRISDSNPHGNFHGYAHWRRSTRILIRVDHHIQDLQHTSLQPGLHN
ncbi:hypothetical protein Scep_016410 [Stephania cephalantha]|uniref:Uncharacterized protein n=1 Tax=Stephania cephalantha TaxID=152367 RepID=A0AAP0IMS8_9MAGN